MQSHVNLLHLFLQPIVLESSYLTTILREYSRSRSISKEGGNPQSSYLCSNPSKFYSNMRAINGHEWHSILNVPVQSELFIEDENGGVGYKTPLIPNARFGQTRELGRIFEREGRWNVKLCNVHLVPFLFRPDDLWALSHIPDPWRYRS